jgi:hypothetical protein
VQKYLGGKLVTEFSIIHYSEGFSRRGKSKIATVRSVTPNIMHFEVSTDQSLSARRFFAFRFVFANWARFRLLLFRVLDWNLEWK